MYTVILAFSIWLCRFIQSMLNATKYVLCTKSNFRRVDPTHPECPRLSPVMSRNLFIFVNGCNMNSS